MNENNQSNENTKKVRPVARTMARELSAEEVAQIAGGCNECSESSHPPPHSDADRLY